MKNFVLVTSLLLFLIACEVKEAKPASEAYEIIFFVPGQLQGSPPLISLLQGLEEVERGLGDKCQLRSVEAGYDQSEWDLKLKKLVASTKANLYVTSNPSMTAVVEELAKTYPDKRFIVFESQPIALPNVVTVDFCSEQLAFMAGQYAACFLRAIYSHLPPYIGIIIGQEYPKMDAIIQSFRRGFIENIGDNAKVSYRVLGNWYDAERARQVATQQYESGVKAILTIAGLANQGVIQAAKEKGRYVMFYEYDPKDAVLDQEAVVFSGFIDYKSPASRLVKLACESALSFGEHYQYGIEEGVLGFLTSTPNLKKNLDLIKEQRKKLKT